MIINELKQFDEKLAYIAKQIIKNLYVYEDEIINVEPDVYNDKGNIDLVWHDKKTYLTLYTDTICVLGKYEHDNVEEMEINLNENFDNNLKIICNKLKIFLKRN